MVLFSGINQMYVFLDDMVLFVAWADLSSFLKGAE